MLKEPIYNWKTRKALKHNAKRDNVSFNKAKHIGVLFENEANYQKSKTLISSLTEDGKQVTVLIKSDQKEPPSSQHYTENQFKWHGKIESSAAQKFISTPFDYLLMLNTEIHFLNKYLIASSKAKCRVGVTNKHSEFLFELMFENSKKEPIGDFYKTVKGYLDKIKTT